MATRFRTRFDGAIYHVMARGNRKQIIFTDDRDRRQFLKILAAALEKFGGECFCYSLMGNHYHLIIHTPRGNLEWVMHHVDSLYARYFNWRHGLTGHVFEGPYQAILIDNNWYLLNAVAYVLRNPVAASMTTEAGLWPWSSYKATMGKSAKRFLTLSWLPSLFDGVPLDECRRLLDEHIRKEDQQYSDLVRTVADGSHQFKKRVRDVIGATLYRSRLPRSYRMLGRPSLTELFAETKRADRRSAILRAHIVHGYRLIEVANYLELHPTTISRIVNQTGSYRLIRD